jgi:ribose 5-phosphate isomerase B
MHIYIGADHGGYETKEKLRHELEAEGFSVEDMGAYSDESSDYPEFGIKVARAVQHNPEARGILLCRSGEGMEIVANKLKGIRAALVWRPDIAAETRRDNDSNVLVLANDFIAEHDILTIAKTFLETEFSGEERHARRIAQITELENEL